MTTSDVHANWCAQVCQDPSQSIRVAKYAVRAIVAFEGQPDPSAAAMSQSQSQTAASQSQSSQSQSQSSSEGQDAGSASGTDVGGLVSRRCHAARDGAMVINPL